MNNRFSVIIAVLLAISAFPNYLMAQELENRGGAIAQINSSQALLAQGKDQYAANQFTAAIQSFQQAFKIYQAQKDVNASIEALNGLGRSYNAIGRYQQAIDAHQQALKLIPPRNTIATVQTLTWLGDASLNLGNEEKGLEIMERAIALTKKISVPLIDQGETIHNLGRAYFRNGRYPQAIKSFNQALEIRQKSGDRFNEGKTLNAIAGVYIQQQDFEKALEFAKKGLKLNQEVKNELGIAISLYNTASIYGIIGQVPKSLEMLQQSLAVYEGFGDRLSVGDILNQISNINAIAFQFTEGLKLDLMALDIFREYGDQRRIQYALEEIASTYANLTQYPKALDFYEQALKAADQITDPELGDRVGKGNILYRMAEVYGTQGQHLKAISIYEKAIGIYVNALGASARPRWKTTLAGIYQGLGESEGALSQYPKALKALEQSLKIYGEIGERRGEIVVLLKIVPLYNQLGQSEKAASSTLRAKELSIALSNENGKPNSTTKVTEAPKEPNTSDAKPNNPESPVPDLVGFKPNLPGKVLENLGDLESVQRDLAFFKKSGNRSFEASSYSLLGYIYSRRKEYDQSLGSFNQALRIYTEIGDRNAMASMLFSIGLLNGINGRNPLAYSAYQKSLSLYRELGNRSKESELLSSLGLIFEFNQPDIAIAFYKQSVNVTEAIRKELKVLPKDQQQDYQQRVAGTYRTLADLLLRQGRVMEALQVLDLLKVQELQGYLQNVKGNDRTAQGVRLLVPEQAIVKQLASQPDRLAELSKQLSSQIRQLPKSELNQVPKYLQNLPSGVVLLYPLILSDRLELIMFSANNPPISRTVAIKGSEFEELVKDFRSDLQNPLSQDAKISGKKVFDLMVKPMESQLNQVKAKTILYAPDGILRYIPLGALYDGKQWLVEQYQVNNLIAYSLYDGDRKPQSRTNEYKIFAGAFGGKDVEPRSENKGSLRSQRLQGLPATITEVNNIAKTYTNVSTFIEGNFTANNIKEKTSGYEIVHLATHAVFNNGSPLESFILFGDGSIVTLAKINEWKLNNTDLVVLSACETGVGTLGTGAEILGFGYQVQRAGAKASIASLWTVSDSGTQLLMSGFYQNLKKQNVLTSLRESQIAMIRKPIKNGEINFNHPYFWSGFVVIGNSL